MSAAPDRSSEIQPRRKFPTGTVLVLGTFSTAAVIAVPTLFFSNNSPRDNSEFIADSTEMVISSGVVPAGANFRDRPRVFDTVAVGETNVCAVADTDIPFTPQPILKNSGEGTDGNGQYVGFDADAVPDYVSRACADQAGYVWIAANVLRNGEEAVIFTHISE